MNAKHVSCFIFVFVFNCVCTGGSPVILLFVSVSARNCAGLIEIKEREREKKRKHTEIESGKVKWRAVVAVHF